MQLCSRDSQFWFLSILILVLRLSKSKTQAWAGYVTVKKLDSDSGTDYEFWTSNPSISISIPGPRTIFI